MGSVACVAGVFLFLGAACLLYPEQVAELGVRLDWLNQDGSRKILARYRRATRWSGRIVGGLLLCVGIILLFVAGS
jgi:uncharacterized membrane protein